MKLYARDIKGNIKQWDIILVESSNCAKISAGRLDGNLIETIIEHDKISNEIASRIAKKRKEGYVSLKDLGLDYVSTGIYDNDLQDVLNKHLPKYNTDANNNLKPMKCQKFKEGVIKYPALAQPKLNGLRSVLRWEQWTEGEGMFAKQTESAKLRTKEGLEYYMPHITNGLTKEHFYKDGIELVFDGELYRSNMFLNIIKSSCPMINSRGTLSKPSGNPLDIAFCTFDLAIPDIDQNNRILILDKLNLTKENLLLVPTILIYNDEEAISYRNQCITDGYEGCVIRDPDQEYAFGFRPSFMRKFKTFMDSEFFILDLIPKPSDNTLPLFILKNDKNDSTFECNPTGNWDYQRELLTNKESYIGKYATVRYRERSGVKNVPFHANVVDIRNTKIE